MLVMVNVNWNALGFRGKAFKKWNLILTKQAMIFRNCTVYFSEQIQVCTHIILHPPPPPPTLSTHTQSSHQQAYTLFIQYTPVAKLHCEHPHWAMGSWPCPAQAGCQAPPCTAVTPAWTWGRWAGVSAQTPADMYTEGQSCEAQHDHSLGQPKNNKEIKKRCKKSSKGTKLKSPRPPPLPFTCSCFEESCTYFYDLKTTDAKNV